MRFVPSATAVVLLAGAVACRSAESVVSSGSAQLTVRGLEQTVQLIPAEPAQGEVLQITSVVINHSPAAVAVVSRICGLDTGGDIVLVVNRMACAGYSVSSTLAPGDSVTGGDMRVVSSPPGHYTLRVRQLLTPETWVDVPVVVR